MKVIKILLLVILIFGTILGIKIYKDINEPEYSVYDVQQLLDYITLLKLIDTEKTNYAGYYLMD